MNGSSDNVVYYGKDSTNEDMLKHIRRLRDGFVRVEAWLSNIDPLPNAKDLDKELNRILDKEDWIKEGAPISFERMTGLNDRIQLKTGLETCFCGIGGSSSIGGAIEYYGKSRSLMVVRRVIFYMGRFLGDYSKRGEFVARQILLNAYNDYCATVPTNK